MTDLARTIIPKSDQLNADDLIAGPRTITITQVRGNEDADQPIAIHFEGDDRKPYKPCKSMRRVMVHCWGADGNAYAGRRLTLFCDPNVVFGGIKVGGIRISHMSDIDREITMALTATRAQRKPFTVRPLTSSRPGERAPLVDVSALLAAGRAAARQGSRSLTDWWSGLTKAEKAAAKPALDSELKGAAALVDQAAFEEPETGEVSDSAHDEDGAGGGEQPALDLAGPDVDLDDWAASFNRGLAALETRAEVEAAWKAAKANGYVLKLKAKSPGMAQALADAVNERIGELQKADA